MAAPSSLLVSTLSVVNLYVSHAGLVTFPRLIANTGWCTAALVCLCAAIFHRAAQLLISPAFIAAGSNPTATCPTYRELMHAAPPPVLDTLHAMLLIDMAGIVVCYSVTLLDIALAVQLSPKALAALGCAYWLVGRSKSMLLQYVNCTGVACSFVILASVLVAFGTRLLSHEPGLQLAGLDTPLVRPSGLWLASGVIFLRLSGNIALPSMVSAAGVKTLRLSTTLGIMATVAIYLLLGVVSVLVWGTGVHELVVQNFEREAHARGGALLWVNGVKGLQLAIMVGILTNLPNWFHAIGVELVQMFPHSRISANDRERSCRTPLVLLTLVVVGAVWGVGLQHRVLELTAVFGMVGSVTANAIGPLWLGWYVGVGTVVDLALAIALAAVVLIVLLGRIGQAKAGAASLPWQRVAPTDRHPRRHGNHIPRLPPPAGRSKHGRPFARQQVAALAVALTSTSALQSGPLPPFLFRNWSSAPPGGDIAMKFASSRAKSLQALWSRPNGPIPRRQIHTHLHREGTGLIWYVKQSCTKRFMREAPFERETNRALVNVVPGIWQEASSKVAFCRNSQAWANADTSSRVPGFLPCYILPEQRREFEAHAAAMPRAYWVWKLDCAMSGKGVKLGQRSGDTAVPDAYRSEKKPVVVQMLVTSPMLHQGHKCDLRLYAMAFFDPVGAPHVLLHRNGGVRVAPGVWLGGGNASEGSSISNIAQGAGYSSRFAISELPGMLGVTRWEAIWSRITESVVHAFLTLGPKLGCHNPRSPYILKRMRGRGKDATARCGLTFGFFGVDVVLDARTDLPYVMEVNADPGMTPWMSELTERYKQHRGARRPAYRMYEEIYTDMLAVAGYGASSDLFATSVAGASAGWASRDANTKLRTLRDNAINRSTSRDTAGFDLIFPSPKLCSTPAIRKRLATLYTWPYANYVNFNGRDQMISDAATHTTLGGTCANLYPIQVN
jgi:hypothetical protein